LSAPRQVLAESICKLYLIALGVGTRGAILPAK
jgi:hypothetical protein